MLSIRTGLRGKKRNERRNAAIENSTTDREEKTD
jgi:hypothetical protein